MLQVVSLGWNESMHLYLDDLHTPLLIQVSLGRNESMHLYLDDLHTLLLLQVALDGMRV